MKVILLLAIVSVGLVHSIPEAPVAPYAPRGWRPIGPSFELPSKTTEPEDTFRVGKEEQTVEVTEEEVQYTGDLTTDSVTTPYVQYGAPGVPASGDGSDSEPTTPPSFNDNLTVQGLPSSEPAKEFRALPAQRLKDGRSQKLRVQQRQKSGRLQQAPQFQNQQFATFSGFHAPNQFGLGVVQTGQRNGKTFGQSVSQFGQLTLPRRPVGVFQPTQTFFQRQEVAEPIPVPAQSYGPSNEYGAPQNPNEVGDIDNPEQQATGPEFPPTEEEFTTTEPSDFVGAEGEGDVLAISNSFSEGERYTQRRQGKSAKLRASQPATGKLRVANLRPFNEPIYTFNQFGQLVRVF